MHPSSEDHALAISSGCRGSASSNTSVRYSAEGMLKLVVAEVRASVPLYFFVVLYIVLLFRAAEEQALRVHVCPSRLMSSASTFKTS